MFYHPRRWGEAKSGHERSFAQRSKKGSSYKNKIVALACEGLDNTEIARLLYKSEQTVANQLTRAYAKLGEWLSFPERAPERSVLIAEMAPYFGLKGGGGK
ncbi:MAG: sigma factor-like helix-turn-helix DNA-binding protein [Thermodesulfobacteriota bacterium]